MDKKRLEFYAQRRKIKKQERIKKRKDKAIKRSAIFAITGILILFFYLIAAASISEVLFKQKSESHQAIEKPIKIANCGYIEISLPVEKDNFTALAFHSAYNSGAYTLKPAGRKVDTKKMPKASAIKLLRNTGDLAYLVMPRSGRNGRKLSAIDIGAEAPSKVKAPISGTVALIKKYKLYGYIDDYEVHILPKGYRDRHMVIIHITDLAIKRGDDIMRAKTVIGRVRQLSKFMKTQLREYSKDKGDHIHLQINKILPNGECTKKNY